MALHFTRDEFAERRRRVCSEMAKAGFDGLLLCRQESMYWLTGYDTSGYSLRSGIAARQYGRRGVRGACQGAEQGRVQRAFPQCLRLHDGRDLSADLDGLADALCRRAAGA